MLVAPSEFFTVLKSAAPRTDVSIHAEFAKDIVAYRAYLRMACTSKFSTTITRPDSTLCGNVVTLAVRA